MGFTLMLFDASTVSGSAATPDYTFALTDDITNGAGWWYTSAIIHDLAWDDVNDVLYVLDTANGGGAKGGNVHAFSLVPEPATLGLLAAAGLLAVRRRR
jgi:hypothetical protein